MNDGNHIVARCVNCRAAVDRNGRCANCEDAAAAVGRLKATLAVSKVKARRSQAGGAWWLGRGKQWARDAAPRPLSGQDAALPPGDRE